MLYKGNIRRIVCVMVAVAVIIMSPTAFSPTKAKAATLAEMQAESEKLQKKAKELDGKISNQEKNLTNQKAYKDTLDSKIDNTAAQIDLLINRVDKMNSQIKSLNGDIEKKEAEIKQKEEVIKDRFQALRQRLRAISKTGNTSKLQMLLDTDSYTDYLIKSKMMERTAKNDKKLMDEIEAKIQIIDAEKQKLAKDKADVNKQLADVKVLNKEANQRKAELDVLYGKSNLAIQKMQSDIKVYEQQRKMTDKELRELENSIKRIIDQNTSQGKYSGGTMYWPVPAVRNLSSFYGPRGGGMHRGIDIANGSVPVYGQNIVAAASGVVIYANYTNQWGGGYGYHIIIDHGVDSKGRKISTLYAHCSQVFTRVGNKVIGGQTVIAKAGRTGNVTGPHLHFEVRVNGSAVDPIANGYIKMN
ncbi:MAG: peptidoglycan DD-metalloendopeptidase family protein [Oscillospiraceae bacterium]|nr:peptidoglycan DD-metalloendopeptidase family protein [Oscillospiraceae bacterium]MDD3832470.1 peptidoglycan DD-metalloendopeptidase family protein [Oscillospiraceae bacterium]MDD4546422.1 peptidoglycan DD-metalloendopeptidase family protein [Oscillospiraceae bacterium]